LQSSLSSAPSPVRVQPSLHLPSQIAYQLLRLTYQMAGSPVRAVGLLLPPFCAATVAASIFIAADTYYFRGDFSKLVITPYDFIIYRPRTSLITAYIRTGHTSVLIYRCYLELGRYSYGLHGAICASMRGRPRIQKEHFQTDILRQSISSQLATALIQIIILSLSVLSFHPHEEPKFLTPMIFQIWLYWYSHRKTSSTWENFRVCLHKSTSCDRA
jgi:phosphatidylinositol glycan class Z